MFIGRRGKIILFTMALIVIAACTAGGVASIASYPGLEPISVMTFWAVAGFCVLSPVISYVMMGIVAGGWQELGKEPGEDAGESETDEGDGDE